MQGMRQAKNFASNCAWNKLEEKSEDLELGQRCAQPLIKLMKKK